MRLTRCLLAAAMVVLLAGGCVNWRAPIVPPAGLLFTNYRAPMTAEVSGAPVGTKVGTHSTGFFHDFLLTGGSFAWDDASIEKAAANGGLSKVYYADYEVLNILGVYAQFTVRAYGE